MSTLPYEEFIKPTRDQNEVQAKEALKISRLVRNVVCTSTIYCTVT